MKVMDAVRKQIKILYSLIFPSIGRPELLVADDDEGTSLLTDDAQLWQSPLLADFTSPPPSKSGLKLVCNVNIVYGNPKSENSEDYDQKPQRNSTFMNSASGLYRIISPPHLTLYPQARQYILCTGDPYYVPYTLMLIS